MNVRTALNRGRRREGRRFFRENSGSPVGRRRPAAGTAESARHQIDAMFFQRLARYRRPNRMVAHRSDQGVELDRRQTAEPGLHANIDGGKIHDSVVVGHHVGVLAPDYQVCRNLKLADGLGEAFGLTYWRAGLDRRMHTTTSWCWSQAASRRSMTRKSVSCSINSQIHSGRETEMP